MTDQAEPATELELAVAVDEIGTDPPRVGIIMGSKSDMDVMDGAASVLRDAGVPHEVRVMSAHREPGAGRRVLPQRPHARRCA